MRQRLLRIIESTLYSCLNVKELLAQNGRDIWNLSDYNGTRTHNHLVRKRTNNWLLVYKLSGCGFASCCSHYFWFCFLIINCKAFETLPKNSAYSFISVHTLLLFYFISFIFCFYLTYCLALINEKLLLPLQCRLNTNLLFCCVKLIGHIASAVNVVISNPCVGPAPRIKTSFLLWSICRDELSSA